MKERAGHYTLFVALALVAGCEALAGLDDYGDQATGGTSTTTTTTSGGSTSTGGSGGAGGTAGSGAIGGGGSGGTAGSGGSGGAVGGGGSGGGAGTLIDTGLLVRYYLDEAASGTPLTDVIDAAPSAFDLQIDYGTDGALSYAQDPSNRGLSWNATGQDGRVSAAVTSTINKIYNALNDSQTATIEVVMRGQDFDAGHNAFFWNMRGQNAPRFSFGSADGSSLFMHWNGSTLPAGFWHYDLKTGNRIIFHMVLNMAMAPNQRMKLYGDSVVVTPGPANSPGPSDTILLLPNFTVALCNWADGSGHSFQGMLLYVALYSAAFSQDDVTNNYNVLLASDDTP